MDNVCYSGKPRPTPALLAMLCVERGSRGYIRANLPVLQNGCGKQCDVFRTLQQFGYISVT